MKYVWKINALDMATLNCVDYEHKIYTNFVACNQLWNTDRYLHNVMPPSTLNLYVRTTFASTVWRSNMMFHEVEFGVPNLIVHRWSGHSRRPLENYKIIVWIGSMSLKTTGISILHNAMSLYTRATYVKYILDTSKLNYRTRGKCKRRNF